MSHKKTQALSTTLKVWLAVIILFGLCQVTHAEDLKSAKAAKKSGNVNQAIRILQNLHKESPDNIRIRVELGASYYKAKNYSRGNHLFKTVLNEPQTPKNVKSNILKYIKNHKTQQDKYLLSNKTLSGIKSENDSIQDKKVRLEALLKDTPTHFPSKAYLILLLIQNNEVTQSKQALNAINVQAISPEDERHLNILSKKHNSRFSKKQKTGGLISFQAGYDTKVSNNDDSDLFWESFWEEEQLYQEEEGFEHHEEFNEEWDEEFDFFDDEFFEEEFEESEFEEEDLSDVFERPTESAFSIINASLQHKISIPNIENGMLVSSYEFGIRTRYSERTYQESDLDDYNYQVIEVGGWASFKSNTYSTLSLPLAVKSIRINDRNYAYYYDAKLTYSNQHKANTEFSLTGGLSYRDYASFNDFRENGLLIEGNASFIYNLHRSTQIKGYVQYSNLDIPNEAFRSYNRSNFGASLNTKISKKLQFSIGTEYQTTQYQGINERLIDFFDDPIYDFNREDKTFSFSTTLKHKLNKHWDVPVKLTYQDRQSNQLRYDFDHTIVTVGLTFKF